MPLACGRRPVGASRPLTVVFVPPRQRRHVDGTAHGVGPPGHPGWLRCPAPCMCWAQTSSRRPLIPSGEAPGLLVPRTASSGQPRPGTAPGRAAHPGSTGRCSCLYLLLLSFSPCQYWGIHAHAVLQAGQLLVSGTVCSTCCRCCRRCLCSAPLLSSVPLMLYSDPWCLVPQAEGQGALDPGVSGSSKCPATVPPGLGASPLR